MKNAWKRAAALVLIAAMSLSMVACGKKETTGTKDPGKNTENSGSQTTDDKKDEGSNAGGEVVPGWKQHADDKVDLSWYINFSWFTQPWGEDLVSKTITEETGVNVEFVVPAGSEAEKLNSMIATDTLPDMLTLGWWEGQVGDMIDAEMVYALNELADEYDPYFWEVADPARVGWYTQADGNIYGYPNSSYSPADYDKYDNIASNQTFLVRKDMYEALGSPDMTTPEGFIDAVKRAKEMFPEVNGAPLIPVGAHEFNNGGCTSFDLYLCNFLNVPYEDENGNWVDRFAHPELKRWLKAFRELGAEGYLADDIFIDQRAQMEEKIAQGRYFCMLYQRTDLADQQKILYANDPNSIYMAIDGPKNSNGDDHQLPGTAINGWTVTMISKNCERPDRALELMSYLMSEHGQLMTWLGVEGETWDYVDGVPKMKQEVKDLSMTDRTAFNMQYGADSNFWMFQDNAMAAAWLDAPTEPLGQMQEWTYPYTVYAGQYDTTFAPDSDVANAKLKIDTEWSKVLPKLLLAPTEEEFDRLWDELQEKKEGFGLDLVAEESTKQIKANKEKLGLE